MTAAAASSAPVQRAVFTQGSTLRHVAVMTATGTVGLMAVFFVDLLSLFYVSRLGDQALKAAVGYASQMLFLSVA
ncbi:MAG TPA: MATE family efflux transporter, partial [Roseiarcus sp.]|nr:MATE family efflux transporter [Roseiarcus sp.]